MNTQMTLIEDARKKVPQVLIHAKENVEATKVAKCANNSFYDKGPWDKGHWANRK
jgi:hypothetical protein